MGPTDAELVARSTRDPAAFGVVFDRHYDMIHRYAVARVGASDGEEIAAQTFLVAFEHLSRYDPSRASVRAWLFGIATNLIRHHHRSRVRRVRALARLRVEPAPHDSHDDEQRVDVRRDSGPMMNAVRGIPSRDRDVLLLYAWAELSYEEIADALGVPIGTVRSRLHRCRHVLRDQLSGRVS